MTETTSTSSSTICQNADENDLCGWLDFVFGEGYSLNACCNEPELQLCCS